MNRIEFQRIEEFQINSALHQSIQGLLQSCFAGYPEGRSFFKQMPDFRYLAHYENNLVAHMAVEHRQINNAGQLIRIFGIADLCVAEAHRHQRIATRLLTELQTLGKLHQIDFLVLQAQNHELYQKNGFLLQNNLCQWLLIQNNQTLGVARRRLAQSLMVKPLGDKNWKSGLTDFLGYVF